MRPATTTSTDRSTWWFGAGVHSTISPVDGVCSPHRTRTSDTHSRAGDGIVFHGVVERVQVSVTTNASSLNLICIHGTTISSTHVVVVQEGLRLTGCHLLINSLESEITKSRSPTRTKSSTQIWQLTKTHRSANFIVEVPTITIRAGTVLLSILPVFTRKSSSITKVGPMITRTTFKELNYQLL